MQSSLAQNAIDRPFDPPDPVKYTAKLAFRGDRLNQYSKGGIIGKGIYGEVYLCRDERENGYELAVKVLRKTNPRDKVKLLRKNYQRETEAGRQPLNSTMNNIRKEIATMGGCRHANIARLVEVIDDPQQDKIYMIMEYLPGGPIQWEERGRPTLTLQQTRRIMRDAILGLEYLHYEGIIHRDIKPANLVYTKDRQRVKIIDFGVAHYDPHLAASSRPNHIAPPRQPEEETAYDTIDQTLFTKSDINKKAGTPAFLAPETLWFPEDNLDISPSPSYDMISSSPGLGYGTGGQTVSAASAPMSRERPPITKAIDIWSLGVTLYCFLFGHLPFDVPESENDHRQHKEFVLYNIICTQDWVVEPVMGSEGVSTTEGSSDTRGSDIMQILHRILQKNPLNRITLPELKTHPWILQGIQNPKEWARLTSPGDSPKPSNWVKSASLKLLKLIPKNR